MGYKGIVLLMVALMGVASGLECVECSWEREGGGSLEDTCLGAPYKVPSRECNTSAAPGQKYFCQTHAEFERKGGEMSLVSLERLCDVKHARCDTECSPTSRSCWSCCQDNNNCNTFPVHVNLVYTSAARSVVPEVTTLVSVLAIAWSTVSRFSQDTLI